MSFLLIGASKKQLEAAFSSAKLEVLARGGPRDLGEYIAGHRDEITDFAFVLHARIHRGPNVEECDRTATADSREEVIPNPADLRDQVEEMIQLVPEALGWLRQMAGLRQIDIAQKSGLSDKRVSSIERGKTSSLRSLATYLKAVESDFRGLQDAIDHVGGGESAKDLAFAEWERLVGRVVLDVLQRLRSLGLNRLS